MIAQSLIGLALLGITPNGYDVSNVDRMITNVQNKGSFVAVEGHLLPNKPQERTTNRTNIPIFKASEFPFVTIVPDDGTDKAGGWQQAKANLEFIRIDLIPPSVTRWKCPITIKMPIRTEKMGTISPSLAATMSASIANLVTIGMDFELPQGIFCDRFVRGVELTFKATFPLLGSRVTP